MFGGDGYVEVEDALPVVMTFAKRGEEILAETTSRTRYLHRFRETISEP